MTGDFLLHLVLRHCSDREWNRLSPAGGCRSWIFPRLNHFSRGRRRGCVALGKANSADRILMTIPTLARARMGHPSVKSQTRSTGHPAGPSFVDTPPLGEVFLRVPHKGFAERNCQFVFRYLDRHLADASPTFADFGRFDFFSGRWAAICSGLSMSRPPQGVWEDPRRRQAMDSGGILPACS